MDQMKNCTVFRCHRPTTENNGHYGIGCDGKGYSRSRAQKSSINPIEGNSWKVSATESNPKRLIDSGISLILHYRSGPGSWPTASKSLFVINSPTVGKMRQ